MDDAARRASVPKREVVVRGGIGSTPAGTSSHKQRSPEVRKPAPQHRSRPHPYPEHLSRNTGRRRHNSPAFRRTWSGGRPGERPSRAGDTYVVNALGVPTLPRVYGELPCSETVGLLSKLTLNNSLSIFFVFVKLHRHSYGAIFESGS